MSDHIRLNSDPKLSNAAVTENLGSPSFRNPIPSTSTAGMPLPPPSLPPRPDSMSLHPMNSYGYGNHGMGGLGSYGGMGSLGMGGYGGMGSYAGVGGYGYGMGGMGGMGGAYGGFSNFGGPYGGNIESRFIQVAEESSRPAFDSIQSVVHAVGSVAMMLENTFIALTSSFRAILGVADNFGRLRSLFAQFWSTFAVIRSLNWLIRKLMVMIGIRTETEFKAWAQAVEATQAGTATAEQKSRGGGWPVLLFFGAIAAAPYIVLRMLNGVTTSISERLNDPKTWQKPMRAVAQHDFTATSPQEISFSRHQVLQLAPQHLQGNLWDSGWLMGSVDRQTAGLVPVPYIKVVRPTVAPEAVSPATVAPDTVTSVGVGEEAKRSPTYEDLEKIYAEEL